MAGRPRKESVKYNREYYLKNKDAILERHRKYRKEHPEEARKWSTDANHKRRDKLSALRALVEELLKENDQLRSELFEREVGNE